MIETFQLKKYIKSFSELPKSYKIAFVLFFVVFTVISIIRALNKAGDSDFHVFWLAGNNFFLGNDLYFLSDEPRQFLYPPFAGFLFGFLAIFPFKVAAVLFSIFNIGLWAYCALISKHIIEYLTKIKITPLVILLVLVFGLNFHISNLNLLQVNLVVFLFTLLFIYHFLRKNFIIAALFIAAATCFKVTPIIFIGWLFFRGDFKAFVYTMLAIVLFIVGPLLIRGIDLGIYDIEQFISTLTKEIPKAGLTIEDFTNNKSLRGLVTNYMIPIGGLADSTKSLVISLSSVLAGLVYIGWLFVLRLKKRNISAFEFAGTFIIILLCSAVTRTAHMVTLTFPLMLLLSVAFASGQRKSVIYVLLVSTMLLLSGDLLLERIHVYGISMIIGFIVCIALSFKNTTPLQVEEHV